MMPAIPRKNGFLDLLLDTTTSTALGRDTLLSLFTVRRKSNTYIQFIYLCMCARASVTINVDQKKQYIHIVSVFH